MLHIRLFGTPRFELEGEPIRIDRRKAEALAAFLLMEPGGHRRSELALLLWPELSPSRARAALRRTLRSLTVALGSDWLDIDRDTLAVGDPSELRCDVTEFTRALEARDWVRAVELYAGEFLGGLTLRDASGFDEWQRACAERFHAQCADALRELVRRHADESSADALSYAERWMRLDPFDERAVEAAMELLIASGKRGAALRLYERFSRRLEQELGVEPPEATALRRQPSTPQRECPEPRALLARIAAYGRVDSDFTEAASAWRWACARRAIDLIDGALDPVYHAADRSGLYREGIQILENAFRVVDDGPLFGRLLSRQAVLYANVGQLAKAQALLEVSLTVASSEVETAFCKNRLGSVLFARGHSGAARRLLREASKHYRASDDGAGLAWTLNVLGHLSIGTASSTKILMDCLERSRRARDTSRLASTLNSIGKDAYVRGDFEGARHSLARGLARRRALSHQLGIADSLNNLANVHIAVGEPTRAHGQLDEALAIAKRIDARPILAEILVGLAIVRQKAGEPEHAARLAAAALYLPGGWHDAKARAARTLKSLSAVLPSASVADATEAGRAFEL